MLPVDSGLAFKEMEVNPPLDAEPPTWDDCARVPVLTTS
jgi:hypothetical protein